MGFGDKGAKDKKKDAAGAAASTAAQAAEDSSWAENDKDQLKKNARAADKEAKADAKLQAKKERDELEETEASSNTKLKGANKGSTKITQAEVARRQALLAATKAKAAPKKKTESVPQPELEANTNRADKVEASGVDAALAALEGSGSGEPKKMTYKEYEELQIPGIKDENPGLKMSQIKERAWKMWERAPENPKNQEKAAEKKTIDLSK